jgi:hypothetical protein
MCIEKGILRLYEKGITIQGIKKLLKREYKKGFRDGFLQGEESGYINGIDDLDIIQEAAENCIA